MGNIERSGIYEKFTRDTGIMTLVHIFTGLRSLVLLPIITKTLDAYMIILPDVIIGVAAFHKI